MNQPPPSNANSDDKFLAEEIGAHVTRSWLLDKRIVVYKMATGTRASIDTWGAAMLADAAQWPSNIPFLALHDIRHLALTPYARYRTIEVAKAFPPNLKGGQATLISPGPLGLTIKLLGTQQVSRIVPNQGFEFFFDYNRALDWLKAKL